MAFTYEDELAEDRDKVRFNIGDTTKDEGPRPGGSNFTDAEIDGLLSIEDSWERTVAAGFEVLAALWARYTNVTVGPRRESYSYITLSFTRQAKSWRERYGFTTGLGVTAVGIIKKDGYSTDVTSDDHDSSGEYGLDFQYVTPK